MRFMRNDSRIYAEANTPASAGGWVNPKITSTRGDHFKRNAAPRTFPCNLEGTTRSICGSDTFNPVPIWEFREAYRWPSRPARSGPQSMPTPAGAWRDADGCCHREKELPETGSASRKVSFLDQPRSRDSGFARWKRNPAADFHRYAAAPGRLAEAIR